MDEKEYSARLEIAYKLPALEGGVLRYRLGSGHDSAHTVGEAARRFGLTREQVKQIERRAYAELKI